VDYGIKKDNLSESSFQEKFMGYSTWGFQHDLHLAEPNLLEFAQAGVPSDALQMLIQPRFCRTPD